MSPRPLHRSTRINWSVAGLALLAGAAMVKATAGTTPWVLGGIHIEAWAMGVGPMVLGAGSLATLTSEVDRSAPRWRFTFGWPRRSLAIAEPRRARAVRTAWLDGWGIHRTRRAWLSNAGGFAAVLPERSNGSGVRLGAPRPHQSIAAIERARRAR